MSNSHYYSAKTGKLIDGGLREARKQSGLPSPSTILSSFKGPGLIRYLQRQMFESAVTTPRKAGWGDDEHFEACMRHADEHAEAARTKGGDFHNLVQRFHEIQAKQPLQQWEHMEVPGYIAPQFHAYCDWYHKYVEQTLAVELVVFGQGYAGRLDHMARMRDGRIAVLDCKTQDISGKKKGRFNTYFEWAIQLGAYSGAAANTPPWKMPDVLISVMVSSNEPVVVEQHIWPEFPATYHKLFLGLLEVWKHQVNYFPTPTVEPVLIP